MAAANYITNYLPVIAALEGVVGGTLHSFLQLDVRLGSTQDFTHPSNVMLQQIFIQGVRNLHPTDECECKDILTAVGNFGQLALKVTM